MEPTQTETTSTPASKQSLETPTATSINKNQKPKSLIFGMVACVVLAIAGIVFGVYEFMDSDQKSQQISELKTSIDNKTTKITELETTISNLNAKNEIIDIGSETTTSDSKSETTTQSGTATIVLGDILDENETRTVFNIGSCTADGPSVKCSITTPNGEALISYVTTDYILRFTLPKN